MLEDCASSCTTSIANQYRPSDVLQSENHHIVNSAIRALTEPHQAAFFTPTCKLKYKMYFEFKLES